MTIYLVRHGQKGNNISKLLPGSRGLTELGKKQAAAFGEYAKILGIKKIYVSPYLRTKETAGIIAEKLNLTPIENEIIAEVGVGDYLNLVKDRIFNEEIKQYEKKFIENLKDFGGKDSNVLLVTHSGYLRMLKAILTKTGGDIAKKLELLFSPMHNLGMTKVVIENDEIKIEEFDNTDFLPEELKNKFPY